MGDEMKQVIKHLVKLTDMSTIDCTPLDAYGRCDEATFGDLRALLAFTRTSEAKLAEAVEVMRRIDCVDPRTDRARHQAIVDAKRLVATFLASHDTEAGS